jgi:transposase
MDKRSAVPQEDAVKLAADFDRIAETIVQCLQMFLTDTLAKRIVSMLLIAIGIKDDKVAATVGLSERSIWTLRKAMVSGNIDSLLEVGGGRGRPRKAKDIERAIIDELEKNNYHTRQQIADMILEKFGVVMSVSTVGRLLKKTTSGD